MASSIQMSWPDGSSLDKSDTDGNVSMRSEGSRQVVKGKRATQTLPPSGEDAAEGKRRRKASSAALPSAAPGAVAEEELGTWLRVADTQLRDHMAHVEPIKAGRSYTNKLGCRIARLAFYAMFRKTPSDMLDSTRG